MLPEGPLRVGRHQGAFPQQPWAGGVKLLTHVCPQEQYIYLYTCLNSALMDGLP